MLIHPCAKPWLALTHNHAINYGYNERLRIITMERKILIVEDEAIVAADMARQLSSLGYTVVGTAFSGDEAIQLATNAQPELVLMDIQLKGNRDGIETAQTIHDQLGLPVIYITAFADDETLKRARITEPFGYLVKPFDKLSLQAAIEVALRQSGSLGESNGEEPDVLQPDCLLIKAQGVYHRVMFTDIDFIQSEGNYCTIFTSGKKYALKISLKQLLEGLAKEQFIQIHKRHIVQLSRIDAIDVGWDSDSRN